MSDVSYSLSRISININGRTLSDVRGAADPDTLDTAPTRIGGGAKRSLGFNEYDSNSLDAPFTLGGNDDDAFLDVFIDGPVSGREITYTQTFVDIDTWPDGACIGFVGKGRLSRGTRTYGDELGEKPYVAHLIGFTRLYKNAPPLTKV